MTKRFTNVNEDIFQYGEWYCSAGGEHCADVIATALNMVTEENEQLISEMGELGTAHAEEINSIEDKFDEEILKLEKENEQLKFQLQSTSAQRDEFYRGARENANRVGKLKKENEELKEGMIRVVDRYIKNVDCNPPSSARTYLKIKGALINIREDLRDLIGDVE